MPMPQKDKRYTYADYYTWDDEKRRELIDGIPYEMFPDETRAMSPAPTWPHQSISSEMHYQLATFLRGKPCKVYTAPFDVRLNGNGDDDPDVVQPDLVVICDQLKLDIKGCNGAPDMVVEILSPSTARRDKTIKFNKYQQAGVREYWIIDPDIKILSTHILTDSGYITRAYSETDTVPVHVLEGCEINLTDVFTL